MIHRQTTTRRGLSLIEFLAVIAVISVLIFLMIPAILNARMAASRTQCINNLKQIVLALHNYQNTHVALPPGVVNEKGPIVNFNNDPSKLEENLDIGWSVQILPFIEQAYLWSAVDSNVSIYSIQNATIAKTQVNIFLCPVERPQLGTPPAPSRGFSSYAACHNDIEAPIDVNNHGVMYLNSHIRQHDVYDGTSMTIYIGEKRIQEPDLGWLSGTRATIRNTGTPLNANEAVPTDPLKVGGFSSQHPGGVNFGFGDGSIRFIRDSIQLQTLQYLGNRDDGELIDGIPH